MDSIPYHPWIQKLFFFLRIFLTEHWMVSGIHSIEKDHRGTAWFTRCWFQIFFIFTPTWENYPIWRSYFSDGWFNHQLVQEHHGPLRVGPKIFKQNQASSQKMGRNICAHELTQHLAKWKHLPQQKELPKANAYWLWTKTAEVFVFSIIFECVWKSMRKPPLVGCWAKNSTLLVYTLDSTINRRFVVKVSGETYCWWAGILVGR